MTSDPDTARQFTHKQNTLASLGIPVPNILATELTSGWMVQQDLGSHPLSSDFVHAELCPQWYRAIVQNLMRMQRAHTSAQWPHFDHHLIRTECALFKDWWADAYCQHPLSTEERQQFDALCERLMAQALTQPQVAMHRDFITRNLMCHERALYWIDFQDACVGPLMYDIASLLYDPLPACHSAHHAPIWSAYCFALRSHHAHLPSDAILRQWRDRTALQRLIKIYGIFARLSLRDHKPHYLKQAIGALNAHTHALCMRDAVCAPLWPIIARRQCTS